jgi:hypothetical protein
MIESPRWLLAQGRITDARLVLAHLTSSTALPTDAIVVAQSQEIEDAIALERKVGGDFRHRELFEGGELQNFRRICLCFGIQVMQQVRVSKALLCALRAYNSCASFHLQMGGISVYIPLSSYELRNSWTLRP